MLPNYDASAERALVIHHSACVHLPMLVFQRSQAMARDIGVNAQPGQIEEVVCELLVEQVLVCGQLLHDGERAVVVCQGLVRAEEGVPQDDLAVVLYAEVARVG